ncbi:BTB/POZ domain-containing protein [Prunus yedoensis var. nudiflora]|uniref:BTB/POZ domain-containing protein n=1 Tax=Prunus yedoensis var. nudiflora TaxID=2094558 RepID=A0A314UJD8_PRUYE|nr:BTB/POZ domain-containing protein [Prunus yedoensis var. nudiflora]
MEDDRLFRKNLMGRMKDMGGSRITNIAFGGNKMFMTRKDQQTVEMGLFYVIWLFRVVEALMKGSWLKREKGDAGGTTVADACSAFSSLAFFGMCHCQSKRHQDLSTSSDDKYY